ncbi:hypothetical protein [Microbispora rosea]|uniref:hypothetical protein n=1 Tax=Microbispora rosea TaxID=58117 RepID=UPI0037BD6D9D
MTDLQFLAASFVSLLCAGVIGGVFGALTTVGLIIWRGRRTTVREASAYLAEQTDRGGR